MKPDAVIFDLDGVITDTAHLHFVAWRKVAAEVGIAIDEQFNQQLKGISRMGSLERILAWGGKANVFSEAEKASLATRKNALYVESLRTLTPQAVLPGIASLLAALRRQNSVSVSGWHRCRSTRLQFYRRWALPRSLTSAPTPQGLCTPSPTRRYFLPPAPGLAWRRRVVSAWRMRRRVSMLSTPAVWRP